MKEGDDRGLKWQQWLHEDVHHPCRWPRATRAVSSPMVPLRGPAPPQLSPCQPEPGSALLKGVSALRYEVPLPRVLTGGGMATAPRGGCPRPLPILWARPAPGARTASARGCAAQAAPGGAYRSWHVAPRTRGAWWPLPRALVTPASFTAVTPLTKVSCGPRGAIRISDLCKSL